MTITAPALELKSYTCPHCGVFAAQHHCSFAYQGQATIAQGYRYLWPFDLSNTFCHHCHKCSLWKDGDLLIPETITVDPPNQELPEDIKRDYLEAASIASKSPRGAAALLRLCVQKLCIHLGTKSDKIDGAIAELVKQGLPVKVQQSLDYVRVIGNEAVHPGQIDVDDPQIVSALFVLVNSIAEIMIEHPKRVESLYKSLPTSKLDHIEQRDKPKKPKP